MKDSTALVLGFGALGVLAFLGLKRNTTMWDVQRDAGGALTHVTVSS